jgi:hypothetical protein
VHVRDCRVSGGLGLAGGADGGATGAVG